MKKTEIAILTGLIISVILSNFTSFSADCSSVRCEVLRLHILANSDSREDQALKICVRNRILEHSHELFNSSSSLADAETAAEKNLDEIEKIAADEIKRQGFDYPVKAYICSMYFETREYDGVTMPAGNYRALRVEIGKAKGKNWWCVLFPALCIPAAQDDRSIQEVFSENELNAVSNPKYKAKFAVVELFERIKKCM